MMRNKLLWEARKRITLSYLHKLGVFAVAIGGFWALDWLVEQKKDFNQRQQGVVNANIADVVATATQKTGCVEANLNKRYATREELSTAMQDRAEACVWESFRATVRWMQAEMTRIAKQQPPLSREVLDDYSRYAKLVEREAVLAERNAQAARQYVAAMLVSRDLQDKVGEKRPGKTVLSRLEALVYPILDETSGRYVIYEILWYGSLLLGVGASSILFILLLTAVPITNGEGYWTSRISQILDRFPGTGRSVAAPLLAAVIGGGTLAGAMAESEPGGQARDSETSIHAPTSIVAPTLVQEGRWSNTHEVHARWVNAPFTYNELRFPGASVEEPPYEEIMTGLGEITREVARSTAATGRAADKIEEVGNKVERTTDAAYLTAQAVQHVEAGVRENRVVAAEIRDGVGNLESVPEQVDELSRSLGDGLEVVVIAADDIKKRDSMRIETESLQLAQGAQRDRRTYLLRTFGRTQYQVGPAVPRIMEAWLDAESSSAADKANLLAALQEMRKEEQHDRKGFEKELRDRLPVSDGQRLIDKHLPHLLRICALPRG